MCNEQKINLNKCYINIKSVVSKYVFPVHTVWGEIYIVKQILSVLFTSRPHENRVFDKKKSI